MIMNDTSNKANDYSIYIALIPILFLVLLLTFNVIFFFDNTLSGPNQIALILTAILTVKLALRRNKSWSELINGILKRVQSSLKPISILIMIGALAGTWMISGIIPLIIYYGIAIINPSVFLLTSVVVCAMVSLATGSSWSTVATVGIALNGIGHVMEIHPGLTAGAIISGAYFGDKISPLSDTTNLASAMTETNIFTHIKYMMYTTVPALTITLLLFMFIGITFDAKDISAEISVLQLNLSEHFNLSPYLLIVPTVLIILIISKVDPLPALMAGVFLGAVFAFFFQKDLLHNLYQNKPVLTVLRSVFIDVSIETQNETMDNLLVSSGMLGMLKTVLLILSAMIFSGAMEAAGFLERIAMSLIKLAKSTGSVVTTTVATSIFFNLTASDQYLAIVVPGRMYADVYKKMNLKSEVLSRALEDAGTQTSVLVPWNTCGATQSSILGVSVFTYMPYCFFNILSPLFSVLWAYLNIKIRRINKE